MKRKMETWPHQVLCSTGWARMYRFASPEAVISGARHFINRRKFVAASNHWQVQTVGRCGGDSEPGMANGEEERISIILVKDLTYVTSDPVRATTPPSSMSITAIGPEHATCFTFSLKTAYPRQQEERRRRREEKDSLMLRPPVVFLGE